jgi:hypothetical protein
MVTHIELNISKDRKNTQKRTNSQPLAMRMAKNALTTTAGCFTPIGVYKKVGNPENIPVNVISIDI